MTTKNGILQFFNNRNSGDDFEVYRLFFNLANRLETLVPNGPEKSTGLRKLLEARDCFNRAMNTKSKGN